MSRALYTAATGMHAQQLKIDVIANNLSNVNTDGFKRSRAEFQDLIYQNLRTAGAATGVDLTAPVGVQVGLGVRPAATARNFEQGDMKSTSNALDVAIEGSGMFQVQLPSSETVFTRNGSFKVDPEGRLVTNDGYPLEPSIVIPRDAVEVTIGLDGVVTARMDESGENMVELGQITLADAVNEGGFESIGRNLFRFVGGSDALRVGVPGSEGFGNLAQGFLEASNVKVVEEMIAMISGQRAYEANSKVIQTADQMMEETNRLR
ncbi:MAG TPA: flagellar basal-body rod protein FlgG [Myxococcales bacterium LLY-WYZ-16_1]|jgi:flagellar basal-body rod protein FlgG|nr:flagellar basal-body rod protein FlgG [Myxococcales bacterium LLY-WYZ-16_1]